MSSKEFDAGDLFVISLIGLFTGLVIGMVFMFHAGTYGKSALLEKGIIEYNKKGEIVWTKEVE